MWKADVFKGNMLDSIEGSHTEEMGDTVGKGRLGPNVEGSGWNTEEYKLMPRGNSKSSNKDIKEREQSIV